MENPKEAMKQLARGQPREALAPWAADCAQRALPLFEGTCPADGRVGAAIEAARAWARGALPMQDARKAAFAAHAAARGCDGKAAEMAARAAGHAAATAHVAGHALHAAEYAAKAILLAKGERAADAERAWQWERLLHRAGEGKPDIHE